MSKGISTNRRTTTKVACLRNAGIDFVVRYYSTTTHQAEKRLTIPEAQAISAAGMEIVTVYEDLPTEAGYFSTARGRLDGANAYHAGLQLGQPAGSAIYFAVDYDAPQSVISHQISDYFRGVKQGFESAAQGQDPIYAIGVYGSGACCRWLKSNVQLAKYSWLAESTGWNGSAGYTDWNIKQSIAHGELCGLTGGVGGSYENNEAPGGYGSFHLSAPAAVAKAVADMQPAAGPAPAAAPKLAAAAPAPKPTDKWQAIFTMKLAASNKIINGELVVKDPDGKQVLEVQATSGTKTHQNKDDIWTKDLGPLPPNPNAAAGNQIETKERSTELIAREFRIRPEEVKKPEAPHTVRNEFRVHQDGGAPGSAGCIAISDVDDFDTFADLMHRLHNHGIETIELELKY